MENSLIELAKYGAWGIAIALVFVILVLIRVIYKIVSNHINHNTDSNLKLADTLSRLSNSVDNNTKATDRLTDRAFRERK